MQTGIYMVRFPRKTFILWTNLTMKKLVFKETVDNLDIETSECLEESTASDDAQNDSAQSYASGAEVSKTKATVLDVAHPAALGIRKPIEGVASSEKFWRRFN